MTNHKAATSSVKISDNQSTVMTGMNAMGLPRAATGTVTLRVSRGAFSRLLHELHGSPINDDDVWEIPVISVEPQNGGFYRIEVFISPEIGAIVAMHEHDLEMVQVAFWKPTAGTYRTVDSMFGDAA